MRPTISMSYGKGRSHGDSAKSLILYGNIGSDRKIPAVVLGRVDIYRVARTDPTSCIIAEKLVSVLSYRVAMRRNSLILQKKFSTRWRHLYISKSHGMVVTRLALGGITAAAPRLSNSVRTPSLSKALSASRAAKSRSVRSGATPALSCPAAERTARDCPAHRPARRSWSSTRPGNARWLD